MMAACIVSLSDVSPAPWRNGGGVTYPLLCWPSELDWVIRISVANIDRSGPFSSFPQIHRFIATLDGDGIALGEPLNVSLRPGSPVLAWPGEIAPQCALLGDATRDLNLMIDSKRGAGWMRDVEASRGDTSMFDALSHNVEAIVFGFFTLGNATLVAENATTELAPTSLVWASEHASSPAARSPWRVESAHRLWRFQCTLLST